MEEKKTKKHYVRNTLLIALAVILFLTAVRNAINNYNRERYMGHGFDYMNGYSSTDFTGYMVHDGEKLNLLDHEASFRIEREEDMPVLDGAEACYPLYSAIAKSVYVNIGEIEKTAYDEAQRRYKSNDFSDPEQTDIYLKNGKYVRFTNTVMAYSDLISGRNDIVFGARPSAEQKAEASRLIEQIETQPIGKEAFVFFVEEDNPVDSLTADQIRAIYHGDITNWKEVGGKDQEIVAFQRPENSGSQTVMKMFMGDVSLKEPKTFEYESAMGGTIKRVAEYSNEQGALGYTFRYFLTGLQQESRVKILKIDGIAPDNESIRNGSYPVTVDVVAAVLASNEKESVRNLMDFLLSDDGQELVERNGYVPLPDRTAGRRIENEISSDYESWKGTDADGEWEFRLYPQPEDYYSRTAVLLQGERTVKGQVGTWINDDGSESNTFCGFSAAFEVPVTIGADELIFGSPLYNESETVLPDEGTVFHRE